MKLIVPLLLQRKNRYHRKYYSLTFFFVFFGILRSSAQVDQNYILTRVPRTGITDQGTFDANTSNPTKVQSNYVYYDESGRPIQAVNSQQSPSGKDIIQSSFYDNMGRESQKWLPYTINNATPGNIRLNSAAEISSFYNPANPGDATIATTNVPYSVTKFDGSPLGRVQEQGYAGESWQIGSSHTVRTIYGTNGTGEVRLWSLTATGASSATYPAGTLLATTITDENGNMATQYKDFDGRLICKKIQSGASTYLSTEYIYDDAGNLRYVIPPLPTIPAPITLPSSFSEGDIIFYNFFYGYHYDGRNRMTEKKVPGKDWEYYVYNKLDQVVLSQSPAQLPLGVWTYFKYDSRGRAVMTGEYTTPGSRSSLQGTVDGFTGVLWDSFINSATNKGYSDSSYPDNTVSSQKKILTVNYYDNYAFLTNSTINPNTAIFAAPSADTTYKAPAGLVTGTLVNVIGASSLTYLLSVNHYDTYGRNVKTISQSFKGGNAGNGNYDIVENQYSFFNNLTTRSKRQHYLQGALQLTMTHWFSYDPSGRKILSQQQYNSGAVVNLAKYDYNELGQLSNKSLHAIGQSTGANIVLGAADALSSGSKTVTAANSVTLQLGFFVSSGATFQASISNYLQNIAYRYNIRGWLTRINDPNNLGTNVFAEQIDYDQPSYTGTQAQYNGNISSMTWQTQAKPGLGSQEAKGYAFQYDPQNRLTSANYKAISGNDKYNEQVTYDELGNVLTLNRNNGAGTYINKLAYDYGSGSQRGNLLLNVSDGEGSEHYTSTYTYHPSGSEKSDSKMLVSSIAYNELNLPSLITLSSGKTISFVYTAAGEKLERVIKQGTTLAEDRSYIHGIEYTSNGIDFVHTDEGRARPGSNGYVLEYQLPDHLGNARAVIGDEDNSGTFSAANDIVQLTDYYAFGRPINYLEANPQFQYKFNGKEYSTDLNAYDYGARYFNPITARWNGIDNEAEKSRRWSPYSYAYNNPIRNVDPDGNFSYDFGTAYANAVSSSLSKIVYNGVNNGMQEQGWDFALSAYNSGQSDYLPDKYNPVSTAIREGISRGVDEQYSAYTKGWGASNGYGSFYYAVNGGGGSSALNWGGLGNFLTHLTPFGGIVDFANSAKVGDVGGAVLGLASTAAFFSGEGAVDYSVPRTTLYRNFAEDEYNSIRSTGMFSIHPDNFQGKQFWVGESGLNMWYDRGFANPYNVSVSVPSSYVTPGNPNYLFLENNRTIDMHPGGTVLPQNLGTFNSVMKINWYEFK